MNTKFEAFCCFTSQGHDNNQHSKLLLCMCVCVCVRAGASVCGWIQHFQVFQSLYCQDLNKVTATILLFLLNRFVVILG